MARDANEQIDLTLRLVESNPKPETFELARGPDDAKGVYDSGRIAYSIGTEGLHMAGNSIGIIRAFSRAPVMFSHSNAKGVFDCPRNVPDRILGMVPANGGIVMVTLRPRSTSPTGGGTPGWTCSSSICCTSRGASGWDHVGLGSDFDGYCLGNFVGPFFFFFFRAEQAPRFVMMLFCVGVQIACLCGLSSTLWQRNRSRTAEHAGSRENEQQAYERGLPDETDFQNEFFFKFHAEKKHRRGPCYAAWARGL